MRSEKKERVGLLGELMGRFEDSLDYLGSDFNLIGRDEEIKEMTYRIASGSMLVIEGKKGSGKTALLKHAIENFKGLGKVAYVDIGSFGKRFDARKLLKKKAKGMILLIDNVDYLSESNNKIIKYFYDQDYAKSVVFTTLDSDSVNFTDAIRSRIGRNVISLRKLRKAECLETVRERIGDDMEAFSDEVLEKLFKDSGSLKELLVSCNLLCRHLDKENKEKIELDDLNYVVKYSGERDVESCLECGKGLVNIGKHWRCEACDEFCGECGVLCDGEDDCPGCGKEIVGDKE